jgi:hypothetical protein
MMKKEDIKDIQRRKFVKMNDFSIKDKCEWCQGTDNLDGIIFPQKNKKGELFIEQATLCKSCRNELEKYLEVVKENE